MKELLLVCLLSLTNGELMEKEFIFGNDDKLTMGFDLDSNTELMRDTEDTPDNIEHDCNTIRPFDADNLIMDDWIAQERTKWKYENEIVKYNHAYGIPIIGKGHFIDDSMRRACYLVRYLFADNEQFRRYAYKSKMYIVGDRGGFMNPQPNVGNSGLSCPCEKYPWWKDYTDKTIKKKTIKFPIKQIKTAAHEMAHYYIKYVLPLMQKAGKLQLPDFIDSPEWKWTTPYDGPYEDGTKCNTIERLALQGPVYEYLWNSLQQDHLKGITNIDRCKHQHYFIYTGQDHFLNLPSGGEQKEISRKNLKENHANLFNILEIIWPCNNKYVSVCEDSAYGMTKGLAQKFIIGKSDPTNPSNMICGDHDSPEIEEKDMNKLSPLPTRDVYEDQDKDYSLNKCLNVARKAGFLAEIDNFSDLEKGEVAESLVDSNERGWWLRKCCAKSAKF